MELLEKQVLEQTRKAVGDSIIKELVGYNKPLTKIVDSVIERNKSTLTELVDSIFVKSVNSDLLKETIKKEFDHKLARTIVSQLQGSIDKAASEIKANPTTKAKMILAIETVLEDIANK